MKAEDLDSLAGKRVFGAVEWGEGVDGLVRIIVVLGGVFSFVFLASAWEADGAMVGGEVEVEIVGLGWLVELELGGDGVEWRAYFCLGWVILVLILRVGGRVGLHVNAALVVIFQV